MFINLQDERIYCLPDGYEVIDHSLADVKVSSPPSSFPLSWSVCVTMTLQYNLNPTFTQEEVKKLDNNKMSVAFDGTEYVPGYIGLNNIKLTDYLNVVVQALAHVPPLRNFFMIPDNYKHVTLFFYSSSCSSSRD